MKEIPLRKATIQDSGVSRHIGNYCTAEVAARAYDSAASELFGEFAYLNFPNDRNVNRERSEAS